MLGTNIKKKNSIKLEQIEKYLIIFLPISIVIGNLIVNLSIFSIITISLYQIIKKKINFTNQFKNLLILFFCLIILNLIFSVDKTLSTKGTIGLLKNTLFFISLYFLFLKNEKNFHYFIKSSLFLILFVSFDTLIQFFFGKDIFGFETQISHGKRLSGPFGDEYVVGAFLSKFLFVGIFYFQIFLKKKVELISFLYILLVSVVIFLSKERAAFYLTTISILFYILYINIKSKKKIFYNLFIFSSIILFLIIFNEQARLKYLIKPIYHLGFKNISFINKHLTIDYINLNDNISIKDTRHVAHFLTAVEIGKKYYFFGSGIKTYREECKKNAYHKIDSKSKSLRCNTHPHQLYLEMFSEGGFLLLIFFLFVLSKCLLKIYNNREIRNNEKIYLICSFIILYFPIQTSGSFFSTFNGFYYWIFFSVLSYKLKMNLLKI